MYSQEFDLEIIDPSDSVEFSYGREFGIKVKTLAPLSSPVQLKLQDMEGIRWKFQPDSINEEGYSILAVNVEDSNYLNETITLQVTGQNEEDTISRNIELKIIGSYYQEDLTGEKADLMQAIHFITDNYPEYAGEMNSLDTAGWMGFVPYPIILIVKHSIFLQGDWRGTVLEHVMIPPHDWKKIFLYNEKTNAYFGINIDTDGEFTEIPCEIRYYFGFANFPPIDIYLSDSTLSENNNINEVIGTFTTLYNFDSTQSYQLVSGNEWFDIISNELQAITVFELEEDTVYIIKVKSTGTKRNALVKDFKIYINDDDTDVEIEKTGEKQITVRVDEDDIHFSNVLSKIEIYNLEGKLMKTGLHTDKINISGIHSGIILLRLYHDNEVRTMKILLNKTSRLYSIH